jgi:hypothetical protein
MCRVGLEIASPHAAAPSGVNQGFATPRGQRLATAAALSMSCAFVALLSAPANAANFNIGSDASLSLGGSHYRRRGLTGAAATGSIAMEQADGCRLPFRRAAWMRGYAADARTWNARETG